jgi:hypothetical protein
MKFKALRKIETKEFVIVYHFEGGGMGLYTQEYPDPKPMSATMENIKTYYGNNYKEEISHLNFDELELVELEYFESGEIGADIQLIDFFTWLNNYEELKYTEKGIKFYVDEYLKINK